MNTEKVIMETKDLSVGFQMYHSTFQKETSQVIKKMNIQIHEGEVVAIVGASGSGKSVLAHAVLGILPDNAVMGGEIFFEGKKLDHKVRKKVIGNDIIMIPQSVSYLDPLMKVGKQVRGIKGNKEKQKEAFERYQLKPEVANLYPFELSGGMARRVLISTAIMKNPKLILADEPTPGLSEDLALETMKNFRELADRGSAILMITHDIDIALKIADTIAVFYEGDIIDVCKRSQFEQDGALLTHLYTKALWNCLPQNRFMDEFGWDNENESESVTVNSQESEAKAESEAKPEIVVGIEPDNEKRIENGNETVSESDIDYNTKTDNGTETDEILLECKNLGFYYQKGKWILRNLNLQIKAGERVGIVSPSGFGKSTLARLISGFEEPKEGQILFQEKALHSYSYCPVQLVYQHPEKALNPRLKIKNSLVEGWNPTDDILKDLCIHSSAWLERWPNELSGGELQRFCVARAMGPQTKLLIADEMTAMLDSITQAQIWRVILKHIKQNKMGLIVITHNMKLAEKVCTRIINLEEYHFI